MPPVGSVGRRGAPVIKVAPIQVFPTLPVLSAPQALFLSLFLPTPPNPLFFKLGEGRGKRLSLISVEEKKSVLFRLLANTTNSV